MERVFEVEKRGTTFRAEAMLGLVQFISCLYVLPVVPEQMAQAGYDTTGSIVATAATCCIGCIFGAFITNTPFIIAPPTSVSIFLAVFMRQQGLPRHAGNVATMISGFLLIAVGLIRPVSAFITRLIPDCIQASTAVGIGLITALAGATEVHLVVRGEHTILDMGPFTLEIAVCMLSVVLISVFLFYHIKGAFCAGLIFGSLLFWILEGGWPKSFAFLPVADYDSLNGGLMGTSDVLLLFDLLFLYILVLNGLARSLSDLSKLTLPDGSIPRGRWLFVVCGITTVISGHMSGPPILISPESAAGVKAGAKTGFSTLVCGALFGVSTFFAPFFAEIPAAGTAPLLIMVGVLLFQNAKRIDWYQPNYAVPAFCCLFFIPFTYSILRGVAFGYATYILIGIFTGDFWLNSVLFVKEYLGFLKVR
jgi:AGZA family xanthine/uracil permease-like MFS transporter